MDPLHKSKRVYALAAVLTPYVARFIVSKSGIPVHEDLMLILNSTITEALSVGIASILIIWSKATEKVSSHFQEKQK